MSLCGECRLPGNLSLHTCSIDGVKFYCVWCVWALQKLRQFPLREIAIKQLTTPPSEVNWDGVYLTQVLADKQGPHWQRIVQADLNYPIYVVSSGPEQYEILDGCHRLGKVIWQGKNTISVVVFPLEALEDCRFTQSAGKD
jgi:hypothetical protein